MICYVVNAIMVKLTKHGWHVHALSVTAKWGGRSSVAVYKIKTLLPIKEDSIPLSAFTCEHLLHHMEGHGGVTNLPSRDGSVLWVTNLVGDLSYSPCQNGSE